MSTNVCIEIINLGFRYLLIFLNKQVGNTISKSNGGKMKNTKMNTEKEITK